MTAWIDKSEQIDALSKAWVQALGEMTDVVKTQTVSTGQYAYTYATLADALQMARPILAKHDLAISQSVSTIDEDVAIFTTVVHSSGQFITSEPLRLAAGKTAQQTGSAVTYGRRYALLAFLGLATEDDDGATASPKESKGSRPSGKVTLVRNDFKAVSGQSRTSEEAVIRAIMVTLPKDRLKEVRAGFVETFGCSLTDLEEGRHSEALGWMKTYGV